MIARPRPVEIPATSNEAQAEPELTDYDYAMLEQYLRLLDAEREGADWREVARIVLQLDTDKDSDLAKRTYDSHIARAHWMTEHGYRHLLREADDNW
jgi:Uncharacterized conserved protein (DUF2285)